MLVKETQPMMTERYCLATAVIDGFIYAIGGERNDGILNTVEKWDRKIESR